MQMQLSRLQHHQPLMLSWLQSAALPAPCRSIHLSTVTAANRHTWSTGARLVPASVASGGTSTDRIAELGPSSTHTGSDHNNAAPAEALRPLQSSSAAGGQQQQQQGHKPRKSSGPKVKQRLDERCLELQPHLSRNVIQSWIAQGKVSVDGKVVTKAGTQVWVESFVDVAAEEPKYVCRAGHKLEAALKAFRVDPTGLTCLDSGQSTGGFTDCLLQHGAAHVYGIDVGYGQVAHKVRVDPRVTVIERFNLRYLTPRDLPCKIDLATLDLAFISVLKVVPAVVRVLAPQAQLVVLIKPQFEAGPSQVGSGGVVRNPAVHKEVIDRVTSGICALGFECQGVIESPLKGDKSGNTEFLAHFTRKQGISEQVAQEIERAAAASAAEERAAIEASKEDLQQQWQPKFQQQ